MKLDDQEILDINLIEELGLDQLPPQERDAALLTIQEALFQGILLRALNELEESEQDELQKVLQANPAGQDAAFTFLREKVPYLELIAQQEVAKFKIDTLNFLQSIDEKEGGTGKSQPGSPPAA